MITKKWQEYLGNYEKEMQDIKLKNGDIVLMCWPNAGIWNVCRKDAGETNKYYYGKEISNDDVAFIRLTHENW